MRLPEYKKALMGENMPRETALLLLYKFITKTTIKQPRQECRYYMRVEM